MIMIDNKYLFMYCIQVSMHEFMYSMNYEIVQYAKCNADDGQKSYNNITLEQTQIEDISCGKEQMCISSQLRQCPHSRRM